MQRIRGLEGKLKDLCTVSGTLEKQLAKENDRLSTLEHLMDQYEQDETEQDEVLEDMKQQCENYEQKRAASLDIV